MTETPTIQAPKTQKKQVKTMQPLQQEVSSMQRDMPRHLNGPINYQWGGTMDGVHNMGGVNVMNFVPVKIAEKNTEGQTVYREVRMSHQEAAKHSEQKRQEQKQAPVEPAKTAAPEKKAETKTTAAEKKEESQKDLTGVTHSTTSHRPATDNKQLSIDKPASKPATSKTVRTHAVGISKAPAAKTGTGGGIRPEGILELATTEKSGKKGIEVSNLQGFLTSSPSTKAKSFSGLGKIVASNINTQARADRSSAPVLKAVMKGAKDIAPPAAKEMQAKQGDIQEHTTGQNPAGLQFKEHAHNGNVPQNEEAQKVGEHHGGLFDWALGMFAGYVETLVTVDEGVNTHVHEHYEVGEEGEVDATRPQKQAAEGEQHADNEWNETQQNITQRKPGETVKQLHLHEDTDVEPEVTTGAEIATVANADMDDYSNADLPEEVRKGADNVLKGKMDAHVQKAQTDADKAHTEHEAEKQKTLHDATTENKKINTDASTEQEKAVQEGRDEVARRQKEGKAESDQILKEHKHESALEQQKATHEINARKSEDNSKAHQTLADAQHKAEQEKQNADTKAAEEKRKADEQSKQKGWWDSFKDKVGSVVKTITAGITKIFSALRSLVSKIIDAAKNAAITLIEAGRKFIVNRINDFRKALKTLVTRTLGKRFPELARKINAKIDEAANKAISGVNKAAGALKKGVTALADKVKKGFEFLTKKFEALVNGAVGFLGAVLTGDFAGALKIAFYTACSFVGADPAKIEGFFAKAGAKMAQIWKDIPKFATSAAKGVINGFKQFGANIGKHLMEGAISWFTGTFAALIIPKEFNLVGIFSLVGQILGLTYDSIKQRVIKKFPQAAGIITKIETEAVEVKDIVMRIMHDGPIALWDIVKEKLSGFKDQVMGQITSMLSVEVIEGALKWIAGLAAFPLGTIIKGALALWDLIKFIRDQYSRISEFFAKIYDMVEDMVAGNVPKISNALEGVLARLIPIGLNLLASILGIGDIAGKVQTLLTKFHQKIEAMTEPLVDMMVNVGKRLLKFGKKVFDKVKKVGGKAVNWAKEKVTSWLRIKKEFKTEEGEVHHLYFDGSETNFHLMVASKPKIFEWYINKVKNVQKKNLLREMKDELDKVIHTHLKQKSEGKKEEKPIGSKADIILEKIKRVLAESGVFVQDEKDLVRPKELRGKSTPNLDRLVDLERSQKLPVKEYSIFRYVYDFKNKYSGTGYGKKDIALYADHRASRKLGRKREAPAIELYKKCSHVSGLTKRAIEVFDNANLSGEYRLRIPDFYSESVVVGDVKDVKEISLDRQMRDNVSIANGWARYPGETKPITKKQLRFDLIVRQGSGQDGSEDYTNVSGPLIRAMKECNGGKVYRLIQINP